MRTDTSLADKRASFEANALPHLDAAYNLARWLTRSSAEADDVVQEAMLRAFRAFDDLRGSDAKPWLLAIVRNCFLTRTRAGSGRKVIPLPERDGEDQESLVDGAANPEQAAILSDQRRKLNRVIGGLPDDFREVLVLREMEDLSYQEIAQVTRVPIGTVMSRLARARALLKLEWEREIEGVRNAVR
jgi:RNA polymerase sigma-70 factor (ECF subfamily)